MALQNILFELVLIYFGASLLATLFLFLRQPIILSYIFLGMLIGPYGLGLIPHVDHVEQLSHFGIILLLFLIGLNMHPSRLYVLFRKTFFITITSSFLFALSSALLAKAFGFPLFDSLVLGLAMMFSSTVISLKLIPTTDLHHNRIGEIMLSVLLLQDIMAITVLLFLSGDSTGDMNEFVVLLLLKTVLLVLFAVLVAKYCLLWLFEKFCEIQEYIFVVALGWCLLIAEMAEQMALSYASGAFIAGISLAISPIALVIAERLKTLREFFLILFFFAIGAQFNFRVSLEVLLPAISIALMLLVLKPLVFSWVFKKSGEKPETSQELAIRLGQGSEFSLLLAWSALGHQLIQKETAYLVQLCVIITFILSTYLVVYRYATPISGNMANRRD